MDRIGLEFSPLLPVPWLWALAAATALVALAVLAGRQRGGLLRVLALGLLVAALFNPSLTREDREKLDDVVAVVVDRSASQLLENRRAQTDRALEETRRQLAARGGTTVRVIEADERDEGGEGTRLFAALEAGLADIPAERLAGIIAITDGRVHDIPTRLRDIGITAPFHGLITGRAGERDRRIEVVAAPRFGIVGREQTFAVRVIEEGTRSQTAVRLVLRRQGETVAERLAVPGETLRLPVRILHAGLNLFEVEVEGAEGELTLLNNIAVLPVEGVRDKLRVLLVSGEPHAGERTWRNLLKADASVELVHFTILRPPEKQDGTPINELSLIAFPTRELFVQKIAEFDLIIFDRYANQSILPASYFVNIARYAREGGAVLLAAGSEFAGNATLARTPLRDILPAAPNGRTVDRAYLPRIAPTGRRHPVTRDLPGGQSEPPDWSPWFRLVEATASRGQTVMEGAGGLPLMVLDRVGQGRVALLLSDHAWLWARQFGEGGPYIDLLRRMVHWLMKEPELEEEALRLTARGRVLTIERQTLAERAADVRLIGPDGEELPLSLTERQPGLFVADVTARRAGLHRVIEGDRIAFAHVGPSNPREFREVTSTTELLAPLATETGGSVRRLDEAGSFRMPRIVDIRGGTRFAGADFIGLRPAEAFVTRGIGVLPLALGFLGLAIIFGSMVLAWLREGRSLRSRA